MSAQQHISPQDYELLSAYIDGELTDDARASLEQRLTTEPTLQQELNSLRNTVNLIHRLQSMAAPRNFTLTADMVTPKNVIQLQPRRRRVRPDYLSLVASVLLMLFGVMFMLSELSQPAVPQASAPAPQPAEAQIQDIEAPAVANAPTESLDETSPVGRIADDEAAPAADGASMEKTEPENTKLPSPLLNQTLADDNGASPELRVESASEESASAGEGFAGADSEQTMDTFAFEEANDVADTQLFDTATDKDMAESSESQLSNNVTDEGVAEAEEPTDAAGIMMMQTTITDTTVETDAITTVASEEQSEDLANNRVETTPEIASQVSNAEENRTLATPTLIPPPAAEPPGQPVSSPISGIEIGLALLGLGLILLVTSLIVIRRNRS